MWGQRRISRRVLALLAASLLAAPSLAVAKPDLSGMWKMASAAEIKEPRQRTPAIPVPPLRPQIAATYAADRARVKAAEDEGRPLARDRELCIPDGMPRMLTTDSPVEIVQTPRKILIAHEFMGALRRIDMTRATHRQGEDVDETFFGDSIGRWDGDVLVVDTTGIKARSLLFNDVPHGPQLRLVERIRLVTPDLLEDEVTMTDPEVLTAPWVVRRVFLRQPDTLMRESVCTENNRNYRDQDGRLATRIF